MALNITSLGFKRALPCSCFLVVLAGCGGGGGVAMCKRYLLLPTGTTPTW